MVDVCQVQAVVKGTFPSLFSGLPVRAADFQKTLFSAIYFGVVDRKKKIY
jgi:hypothetical protein